MVAWMEHEVYFSSLPFLGKPAFKSGWKYILLISSQRMRMRCPHLLQFLLTRHKDPVNAQEEKGVGRKSFLHPFALLLALFLLWFPNLPEGSAVSLQGLHVFPSALPCCTRTALRLSFNASGCKGRRTLLYPAPTAFISPQEYL